MGNWSAVLFSLLPRCLGLVHCYPQDHRHLFLFCSTESEWEREREREVLNVLWGTHSYYWQKLTYYLLDEVGKIFITSSFKHFNKTVIGGIRAKPSPPPLQCSPPERERGRGSHTINKEGSNTHVCSSSFLGCSVLIAATSALVSSSCSAIGPSHSYMASAICPRCFGTPPCSKSTSWSNLWTLKESCDLQSPPLAMIR